MGKKVWVISTGVLILFFAGFYFSYEPKDEVEFRQVPIQRGDLKLTILSTGVVQPENHLEIKPPIAGRVEKVLVREGDKVKKGQILAWMSSSERAALLDAARAKGPEEVKRWSEYYPASPIVAPINGTLILRNVESGQTFAQTDAVFKISDRLTIKANVDETDIAKIQLKQRARIVLDAYPEQPIRGRVERIAFDAKTVNSVTTYEVTVLPEEVPAFMRSGMTANVRFHVETRKNIVLVPNEAIKRKDGRIYVLVATGNAPAERDIRVGASDGKLSEVADGLKEGDIVLAQQPRLANPTSSSSPFSPMRPRRRSGR